MNSDHSEIVTSNTWEDAFDQFRKADAAYRRYDSAVFKPAYARQTAFEIEHGIDKLFPADPKAIAVHEADNCEHKVPDDVFERLESLCDQFSDSQSVLMKMPAPHLHALRWKLDHILQIEHEDDKSRGSLPAWSAEYVGQMLTDITVLLPEQ